MKSNNPVEIADRYSRKRTILVAFAALTFTVIHLAVRSPFVDGSLTADYANAEVMWAVNAFALLLLLATGGGLLNRPEIRFLVNDEVARENYRSAVGAGYWAAMTTAMGLFVAPGAERFTARDAVFLIVTAGVGMALLAFAYLEHRAHLDA